MQISTSRHLFSCLPEYVKIPRVPCGHHGQSTTCSSIFVDKYLRWNHNEATKYFLTTLLFYLVDPMDILAKQGVGVKWFQRGILVIISGAKFTKLDQHPIEAVSSGFGARTPCKSCRSIRYDTQSWRDVLMQMFRSKSCARYHSDPLCAD